MLKNILILGGLAVGGYFGYKWLTKKKAAALPTSTSTSNVQEYGSMYIPGLDPLMTTYNPGFQGTFSGAFGATPIRVIY